MCQRDLSETITKKVSSMAHHSGQEHTSPFKEEFNKMALKLGATGAFPQGKLNAHDEGEIQIAVGNKDGKVILDFGKPVVWMGMDPNQATAVAASLIEHAKRVQGAK